VHPNPNVKKFVFKSLNKVKNIKLIEPVNYVSMVYLMMKSYLIITDSGGIQEEAPSLNKPLLILRDETERPEVIKLGAGKLIKKNKSDIILNVERLLSDKKLYKKMSIVKNPYGDGKASIRITNVLKKNMKSYYWGSQKGSPHN
jgi:UDP-N-acetylglucosamine 2-epimerase (non-hydrolysing)